MAEQDASATAGLRVHDLGTMGYAEALDLQRDVNRAVSEGREPETLLLVEHPPTITITPRKGAASHLLASPYQLRRLGITLAETDRGGDITYHGPGQLVAYPILRMNPRGLNLSRYMRLLESVVIDVLAGFGVQGHREDGATGVWAPIGADALPLGARVSYPVRWLTPEGADREPGDGAASEADQGATLSAEPPAATGAAKICAMGVRVRKNTTMHGLALNVAPDLSHFLSIVPCGLVGRPVTSLAEQLGGRSRAPGMGEVKDAVAARMQQTAGEVRA